MNRVVQTIDDSWIPCDRELPDFRQPVMAIRQSNGMATKLGMVWRIGASWYGLNGRSQTPTHWKPTSNAARYKRLRKQ